jgi:branched-chain amino acid transport system substrate-binding protein
MNDGYWTRLLQRQVSRRRAIAGGGAISVGALLAACGGGSDDKPSGGGEGPSEVRVGAVVPLTGRYAAGGAQIKNGYEIAVDDINSAGGVQLKGSSKKVPLKLDLLDDASDPNQTVQRLETLYSNKVVAYLGGFGSDLHAAAAPIAEKNKTPYLGVAFALYSIHQKGYKYLFSPFIKTPGLTKAWFEMMSAQNPKPTKLALFPEKTDWGAEMREHWRKEASAKGFQIVVDEEYAPGASDLSPLILKARSAGADAVLSLPTPPDGALLQRQLKELDYSPKLTFIVRAADAPTWSSNFGKDGDYVLVAPGWSPDLKYDGVTQFNSKHQQKYNTPPGAVSGPAYVAVQVLADALSRASKLDGDAVRDALTKTDVKSSIMGPVKFNSDGTGQVANVVVQWQSGKLVSVWPKEVAGGSLLYPAKPFKER